MSPWYDKAEGFMGVTGTKEGLRTAPDGNFLPPIQPRVHETLIQKACGKLDMEAVQQHIDGIAALVPRLGEIITKAGTVQKSGEFIEGTAKAIKDDIKERAADVLRLLRLDAA